MTANYPYPTSSDRATRRVSSASAHVNCIPESSRPLAYHPAPIIPPGRLLPPLSLDVLMPGSQRGGPQAGGTNAMLASVPAPGINRGYPTPALYLAQSQQGTMGPVSPSQTSGTGAMLQGQPLATCPAPRVYFWTRRSDAVKASRMPLSDVEKYIIMYLRGDESRPSMSHDGIHKMTGFPKVTIKRVRTELRNRQLPQMILGVVANNEEGDPIFVSFSSGRRTGGEP
ncbi:MAG: hypothetical protein J3Q66DRAFT_357034 [Benniella sp.]|nr:MAG: hypothetical protein J3Q66DRAFT_357034 [Benniella sp.]